MIDNAFKSNLNVPEIHTPAALHMASGFMQAVHEGLALEGRSIPATPPAQGYDYTTPDHRLYESLKKSVYRFSAAKSYAMNQQLTELLRNGDSYLSLDQWRNAAARKLGVYIGQYDRVEHAAAVSSAQMSAIWGRIQENAHIMPYVQFKTSKGDHVCPICAPYHDMIFRHDSPVLQYASPLLHFYCYCTLLQLPESHYHTTPQTDMPDPELIPKIFRTNYAQKQQAFPPDHPYYDGIEKKSLNAWVKKNMPNENPK